MTMSEKESPEPPATSVPNQKGTSFVAPNRDVSNAAAILSAAADITFIVDAKGLICDEVIAFDMPDALMLEGWKGRSLFDLVTVECKVKVARLLARVGDDAAMTWHQLNHPVPTGADVPVRYMAIPAGMGGHRILVGRNMADLARVQQSFVAAAQALELERARARLVGNRLGSAFAASSQSVLIVDAGSGEIIDVNPSAAGQFGKTPTDLVGLRLQDLLGKANGQSLKALTADLAAGAKSGEIELSLTGGECIAGGTMFRWKGRNFVILNLMRPTDNEPLTQAGKQPPATVQALISMPEGFVLVDLQGNIIAANPSFLALAGVKLEESLRGQPLGDWLGEGKSEHADLIGQLMKDGGVRDFRSAVRGELGRSSIVDVSGVRVDDPALPCIALIVSRVSDVELGVEVNARGLARARQQSPRLIGQATLKDLAGEATARIERICIESALAASGGNRTAAAAWLGLSRQSLYEKLDRYGIGGPSDDTSGQA